jgi:hypothetical protein
MDLSILNVLLCDKIINIYYVLLAFTVFNILYRLSHFFLPLLILFSVVPIIWNQVCKGAWQCIKEAVLSSVSARNHEMCA